MIWVIAGFALLAAGGLCLGQASRIRARRHALSTPSDELHRAETPDGWLIALHRYRPVSPLPGADPVLLCHGLLTNRFSLDLDERRSLARWLRGRGHDVWLMELRGHGDSVRREGGTGRYDWCLDQYVDQDLPAAVRCVLSTTGATRLHWIGHSLGGMILYAHCLGGETGWFRSAVTIDSPGHLAPLRQPTWPGRLYARLVPVVPVYLFKPIFDLILAVVPERILYDDLLLDRKTLRLLVYNALVDRGSSLTLLQLCRMAAGGRFASLDGKRNYEEGPRRIDFPLLVLRAPGSRAPEATVVRAWEDSPSARKELVRLGRAEGLSMDHNHFSVVLGEAAPDDVFPLIDDWLSRR